MEQNSENSTDAVRFLSEVTALTEGLRLGGAGVWRWRVGGDQLDWTANLESVHHLPPGSFDGTLSSFQRDLHPDDADSVWQKITASIDTEGPYRAVYRTAAKRGQGELWIEAAGGVTTDPDGARYLTGICFNVTEKVRSEQQLRRRLVQQREVARFGSFALNEGDLHNVLNEAVRVAARVLDVPLTKILQFADAADHLVIRAGIGWADGLVGQGTVGTEGASQAGFTLLANEPVIVADLLTETRFSGPALLHDHQVRSGISVVIPGEQARPFGVFGIHAREVRNFDNADAEFLQSLAHIVAGAARQSAASDHRMLLVREMAHRAGNMLQLVNSLASLSFKVGGDMQLARKNFSERLSALGRANNLVARGGWSSTPISELVTEALKPFGDRVVTEGRDILLPPEFCFDMGLVLHELATNSAKYGTLGDDQGAIHVNWIVNPRSDGSSNFCFTWEDPLSACETPATGTGFGSKLISALVEQKWKGVVTIADTSNFKIAMEVPLVFSD